MTLPDFGVLVAGVGREFKTVTVYPHFMPVRDEKDRVRWVIATIQIAAPSKRKPGRDVIVATTGPISYRGFAAHFKSLDDALKRMASVVATVNKLCETQISYRIQIENTALEAFD